MILTNTDNKCQILIDCFSDSKVTFGSGLNIQILVKIVNTLLIPAFEKNLGFITFIKT